MTWRASGQTAKSCKDELIKLAREKGCHVCGAPAVVGVVSQGMRGFVGLAACTEHSGGTRG